MGELSTIFFLYASVGIACMLVYPVMEVWNYPWRTAIRRFRFSLTTLLAVTSAFAIAMGIDRLQHGNGALLAIPFPVTLLFCLVLLGIVSGIAAEFLPGRRNATATRSALEFFRGRRSERILPFAEPPPGAARATDERATPKTRRKWWLQRMPNRFRSISHRASQETPMVTHYRRLD